MTDLTLAAVVTPPGRGAVATIVVDGPAAASAVDAGFCPAADKPVVELNLGQIYYGKWRSGDSSDAAEDLVVCRRDAERIEIHCHGGRVASAAILADLVAAGCTELDWRVWLKDDEWDSIRCDARRALADAPTRRTAEILLDQYEGALRRHVEQVAQALRSGEEAIGLELIEQLLRRIPLGRHLTRPWKVGFVGPPNVGKSSLVNAALGYQRSIVFDQPGTTRDIVTADTAIDGWPVELIDSAGQRESDDEIEQAGVALARHLARGADLVVLVLDGSQKFSPAEQELWLAHPDCPVVYNKLDLCDRQTEANADQRPPGLLTSALTGDGIEQLLDQIAKRLVANPPPAGAAVPFTDWQGDILRRAHELAMAGQTSQAADHLVTI